MKILKNKTYQKLKAIEKKYKLLVSKPASYEGLREKYAILASELNDTAKRLKTIEKVYKANKFKSPLKRKNDKRARKS